MFDLMCVWGCVMNWICDGFMYMWNRVATKSHDMHVYGCSRGLLHWCPLEGFLLADPQYEHEFKSAGRICVHWIICKPVLALLQKTMVMM